MKAPPPRPIDNGSTTIRPQPGPQETFLSSSADIAIYGGAAGGGKTWAALFEPLRHVDNSGFEAVIFRRTCPQIKQTGGLWVKSEELYPLLGAKSNDTALLWTFPGGMRVKMAHMQHEKTKLEWQGSEVALLIFDELTHFTETQFFYFLSRNRSTCGVIPYIRATCNPDADSWVAGFIAWWIDQDTGLPIPQRSGVIRWFVRDGDNILWGDTPGELRAQVPHWEDGAFRPKSVTFVSATVYDNPALLAKDPGYLANLMALPRVEREQLLGGNWKIRAAAGLFFKEEYFETVDAAPISPKIGRCWDFAGTEKKPGDKSDPDWTVGLLLSRTESGLYFVEHVTRFRGTPHVVEEALKNTASSDGRRVRIGIPQDPAQAGKFQANYFVRALAGYDVRTFPTRSDKQTKAKPVSAQAEAGNIKIVRGAWNKEFLRELANFPDGLHDDQVDALSDDFAMLTTAKSKVLQGV